MNKKDERKWAEKCEANVAKGLDYSGSAEKTCDNEIADTIKKHLSGNGVSFDSAQHSGAGNYDTPGDVALFDGVGDKVDNIELKFSKNTGSGTFKNLGGTWFKKGFKLLDYYAFHKSLGFEKESWKLVMDASGSKVNNKTTYHNALRDQRDKSNTSLIEKITDMAEISATKYASYISDNINESIDVADSVIQKLIRSNLSNSIEDLNFYYIIKNYDKKNQSVSVLKLADIKTKVCSVSSVGKSIIFLDERKKEIFRFSVHWKNICQGGQSPCFNVFLGKQFVPKLISKSVEKKSKIKTLRR